MLTQAALMVALAVPAGATDCEKDVKFALDELPKACGHFFKHKGIDWKKVTKPFRAEAKKVETDQEHWALLARLVARLEDGHAYVKVVEGASQITWPERKTQKGPGLFFCVDGKKVYVKNSFRDAAKAGVKPGMQVIKVDGRPVLDWLETRVADMRDLSGYSTDHQALYAACHWGLAGDEGTRMKLQLRTLDRKGKRATLMRSSGGMVPFGPAFFPEKLETVGRQAYGKLPSGFGYIHLRNIPSDVLTQLDQMLAKIGNVPGLILDCRANGGGGCDHAALFGRFLPTGTKWARGSGYKSAGPNPYGGPMVVIVDEGVRSAGETVSGQFKEDGRAYMIGTGPTAGMSSSKKFIDLPSGKFQLYVSIASNKGRFNQGNGIEGIGVPPNEVVALDPKDLAEGVDTLIKRAEEILRDGPPKKAKVAYKPEKQGWTPPE